MFLTGHRTSHDVETMKEIDLYGRLPYAGFAMVKISTFSSDITPPIGHPLCAGWYPPAIAIDDKLCAHGLILKKNGETPMVLCALDWAELSNHDYLRWRSELAAAVGTTAECVAVHCVHQHDTPWPDREAQDTLDGYDCPNVIMSRDWCESVRTNTARAAAHAVEHLEPCNGIATGLAKVGRIASNRRVMGNDGKVRAVRYTVTRDPEIRAAPIGLIDPLLRTISFWRDHRKLAALHYYAVHPTSYDRTGRVTPEFVGLARDRLRMKEPGVAHLYFTGCAGNITAGKFNDGNHQNRRIFAERIYNAMRSGEREARIRPLQDIDWLTESITLPPREDLKEERLRQTLSDPTVDHKQKSKAALKLTYLQRPHLPIPISCLQLNRDAAILHLPGEAFIEYQLFAQQQRPDSFVAVASYGDLGTGYITLQRSFAEGGYEPTDSFVSGKAEAILKDAIRKVLSQRNE